MDATFQAVIKPFESNDEAGPSNVTPEKKILPPERQDAVSDITEPLRPVRQNATVEPQFIAPTMHTLVELGDLQNLLSAFALGAATALLVMVAFSRPEVD